MEQRITIAMKKSSICRNDLMQKLEDLTIKVNSVKENLQKASTLDEVYTAEQALMELSDKVKGIGVETEESEILTPEHREQLRVKYDELYDEIRSALLN